jgi:hypothetical protein
MGGRKLAAQQYSRWFFPAGSRRMNRSTLLVEYYLFPNFFLGV